MSGKDNKSRMLVILAIITLMRGLIYSAVTPPWQAPDEPKHFEYVWLVHEKRRLVTVEDASFAMQQAIIASMNEHKFGEFGSGAFDPHELPQSFQDIWGVGGANTLLHRPPLFYLLSLPIYALVANRDIITRLYTLRLVSVILGMLTVLTVYLTTRELFPDDEFMYLGVPSFVAWLPMLGFLVGSFHYDTLAILLISLIWYVVVVLFRSGGSRREILCVTALVAGAIVTKRTTVSILPVLLIAASIYLWTARKSRFASLRFVVVATVALTVLISSGILGWMLSGEEGRTAVIAAVSRYLFNYSGQLRSILNHLPELEFGTAVHWVHRLFISFWADFGWLKIRLAPIWYTLLAVVCVAATGGLLLFGFHQVQGKESLGTWRQQCLFLFGSYLAILMVATMAFFIAYIGTRWERAPQGRHLFLGVVPFSILFMLGLRELMPGHKRLTFLVVVLVCLVGFDLLCLTRYIIPSFYG